MSYLDLFKSSPLLCELGTLNITVSHPILMVRTVTAMSIGWISPKCYKICGGKIIIMSTSISHIEQW